jgi:uncharacterized protein (TIGR02145 family)
MKKKIIIWLFLFSVIGIFASAQETVTDIDGNVYQIVTIGTQTWMAENLKTTKYNDGIEIPYVIDNDEWYKLNNSNPYEDGYCWYDNDKDNKDKYGAYYSYAAIKTNKLCPADWHIPLYEDWRDLKQYLADNGYSWSKESYRTNETAKSLASISGWKSTDEYSYRDGYVGTDQASNNKTGFTGIPAGWRKEDGLFEYFGEEAAWAVYLKYNDYSVSYVTLSWNSTGLGGPFGQSWNGINIRCMKGTITNSNSLKDKAEIQIYPNPAKDKIYINCADRQGLKMKVFNVVGDCVFQRDFTSGTNLIDINSLTKGIYSIQLIGADKTIQQKLIKE